VCFTGQFRATLFFNNFYLTVKHSDQNCSGGNQVAIQSTFILQRNEEKIKELLSIVDKFFEDHGLSHNIETLNVLTSSLFPDPDGDQQTWNLSFIQDAHHVAANINQLLSSLYELRRLDLYKKAWA
jgi:hypothetical protein